MRWSWVWSPMLVLALSLGLRGSWADELHAPNNVRAEPSSPRSMELATQSATADMKGQASEAVRLADGAIRANPHDPWPYYDKGMALARVGETDAALAALVAAEQHFSAKDKWGKSLAMYGRANALASAGRCAEARQAYDAYASFVERDDAAAARLARQYSADCRAAAQTTPAPAATTPRSQR